MFEEKTKCMRNSGVGRREWRAQRWGKDAVERGMEECKLSSSSEAKWKNRGGSRTIKRQIFTKKMTRGWRDKEHRTNEGME